MSDTVGDIQNYLADFNPKDPVISKAEPVLTGGEAGDDSELLSSAVGGGAGQYFVDQETGQYYFQSSTGDTLHVVDMVLVFSTQPRLLYGGHRGLHITTG